MLKTEKDCTRIQPTKPQKEIRKKHYLRWAYPCTEKIQHVHISSTSGSTKYTSINDWKIHNGSSDHDRTSTCLKVTYKNVNDAERWSGSLISKTDPKKYQRNMMEQDGTTLQTQVLAYQMLSWMIATYKVKWYLIAATRETVKWTNECWYNLRSSPTTVVHFYNMGINDLKSTMWEIIWLLVIHVYR